MRPIIRVENLGKQYRIGARRTPYLTLRESLTNSLRKPLRWLRGERDATENDFWALKDVSFEVRPGEVIGIIGRNGAGKSTLLKVLSRITEPSTGQVELYGRLASLLEVGTGFHPELTGRENVFLNGAILGMKRSEIRRKFDEIVDFAGVEKFLDTPVKHYSSGMYVRLAFAVAAHLEPEILIVDEVLAVGDAQFQKKCLGKMEEVAGNGRTVLFVSHNMAAVTSLCNRSIWLSEGRLRTFGPTKVVVAEYADRNWKSVSVSRWNDADGPTGQGVRLRYAAVTPCESNVGETITVRTSLQLEFEFATALDTAELNFSIVLDEIERGCIFNTGSEAVRCPRGLIRGSFVIPGHFLNDGFYTVRVLLVKDTSVPLFDMSNVLTFQVADVEREGNWYGRWIGAVRPTLAWAVSTVSEQGSGPNLWVTL